MIATYNPTNQMDDLALPSVLSKTHQLKPLSERILGIARCEREATQIPTFRASALSIVRQSQNLPTKSGPLELELHDWQMTYWSLSINEGHHIPTVSLHWHRLGSREEFHVWWEHLSANGNSV